MNNPSILVYRVSDACRALGISRTSLYRLIGEGSLKAAKIAGRTVIPRSEVERLVADSIVDALPPSRGRKVA